MGKVSHLIVEEFEHAPTRSQQILFDLLDSFFTPKKNPRTVLLIKGYAGTGKTTIMHALTKILPKIGMRYCLLAPTGRAAKVLSNYTRNPAHTIHRKIYKHHYDTKTGTYTFHRLKNKSTNTVYVIDETSMLSGEMRFGKNSILADLLTYVFESKSNQLILIGDYAQLPPVGELNSWALDKDYLEHNYAVNVLDTELVDVVRQEQDSGILNNATSLRNLLKTHAFDIKLRTSAYPDVYRMTGERLEDGLRYAYDKFGLDETTIVTRSNKAAVQYNKYIRHALFYHENELEVGDRLMVVKNNYFVLSDDDAAGFIANGDFVEVLKVRGDEEIYNLRFVELELRLIDMPEQSPFLAKVILDTLHHEGASLPESQYSKFYNDVVSEYVEAGGKGAKTQAINESEYLNALQIKYAYALTCHKSQGGQWDTVFLDQGYVKDDMVNEDFLRWLYTAFTRAKKELYLINFHDNFFV